MMEETITYSSRHKFEQLYIQLRKKESRYYTDEEVGQLPSLKTSHPHYLEWQVRKRSATRLTNYLENRNGPLSILEAGCGNGWLSARLAGIKDSTVTATDINRTELWQAVKVFNKKENLRFMEGDIREINWAERKFDVIVFAAAIQYYPFFHEIIQFALSLLNKNGEIHILDSYFYKSTEIEMARQRSHIYYRSLGCEEMTGFYFHHSIDSLQQFNYSILYDPAAIRNKLLGRKDPFPWISITAT